MKRRGKVLKQAAKKTGRFSGRDPEYSPEIMDHFNRLAEANRSRRLSRNLRKMLIEFLSAEGAMEASYLPDLLYDLECLFELLDAIDAGSKSNGDHHRPAP